jgi:hypothetical protein
MTVTVVALPATFMSAHVGGPVALARTKAVAITEPLPDAAPLLRPWAPRIIGRPLPMAQVAADDAPLRRCTYRRLSVAGPSGRGAATNYTAECLYEGLDQPLPMGDLGRAWSICHGCTNPGIFRADED